MTYKVLICGLSGSGKTTLAKQLSEMTDCVWLNGDNVRKAYNNFDFSYEGRILQAETIKELSEEFPGLVIADFIAPTKEIRKIFDPDFVIFMDTVSESSYKDTDAIFEQPDDADLVITNFDYDLTTILEKIHDK